MKPAFGRKSLSKTPPPSSTVVPEQKVDGTAEQNRRTLDKSEEAKFLSSDANVVDRAYEIIEPLLEEKITPEQAKELSRAEAVTYIE